MNPCPAPEVTGSARPPTPTPITASPKNPTSPRCRTPLTPAGMYSDAVRCALALDLGLAKSVAGEPEGDDQLRRKLWLQVG